MLSDFLLGLATDEQRLAEWKENPDDFPADLSDEERDERQRIRRRTPRSGCCF
jgi:hypothetical protein